MRAIDDKPPAEVTWSVKPGDMLVILSGLLAGRRTEDHVVRAGALLHAGLVVERLLEKVVEDEPPVGLAAAAALIKGAAGH